MNIHSLRWAALTAFGLSAGIGMALVLEDPVEALVGMVLLTPVLTIVVGASLGAFQWLEFRHRVETPGRWILATALGLGIGLAVGIVAIEIVGQALLGHPVRLLQQAPLARAVTMLIVGFVSGGLLGLAQLLIFRKTRRLPRMWPLLSACGLSLGFAVGSLLAQVFAGGITSPAGVLVLVVTAGAVLGASTARPAVGAVP
ncbi:MAG TPA: hypothetical protein VGG03_01985 [Thermoanaerobaculia bacterium]|jgi:hypothetical protein